MKFWLCCFEISGKGGRGRGGSDEINIGLFEGRLLAFLCGEMSKFLVSGGRLRFGQSSITISLRPLTAHTYHIMITMTNGFSKKSFLYYFLEILWNDLDLFSWILRYLVGFTYRKKVFCQNSNNFVYSCI